MSLANVEIERDFGVVFDTNLSYDLHLKPTTSSASKMLGFAIRNTRHFHNIQAINMLYFSLIRS